jgi:adenylate cyclase
VGEGSRQELARRAGVRIEDIDRLIEVGLVRPDPAGGFAPSDVRKARWIISLERAGIPPEGMAKAVGSGGLSFDFLDTGAFDRFAGHTETTFRELSEQTGVQLELLVAVREAAGYAEPSPDDQVREYELAVVPLVQLQLSAGFRPTTIESWLRAGGDNLRRIVETETEAWRSEVAEPLLRAETEREMLDDQADLGARIAPLMEQALIALYRGQQEHVWMESAVETVEAALEGEGLLDRLRRAPAMCFLDITGYTRLTEERGDEAAADLASKLSTVVRRSSMEHGGQPVKWLGDGVMFYFRDPGDGVLGALDMVEEVSRNDLPPAHVGIHAGPVIFQEGDYYGRTVNIAARIADHAGPGEVLVTREVVEASAGLPVTFTPTAPVELKGVSGPLSLHRASRRSSHTS